MGKPLLDVLREMMLDPSEQAAYADNPQSYMARFGYEDVDTEHLNEAFSLVADTLPPDQAQAVADTAPGPIDQGTGAGNGEVGDLDDGLDAGLTGVGADTADLNGIDALRPAPQADGDGDGDGGAFGGVDDGFDLTEGFDDVATEGDGGFGSGEVDVDPIGDSVDDLGDIDDGVGSGDIGPDDGPVDFGGGSEATSIAAADVVDVDDDGGLAQLDGDDGLGLDLDEGGTPAFDDTPDYDDDGVDDIGVGADDGGGHLLADVDDGPDDGPADDPSFDDIGSF